MTKTLNQHPSKLKPLATNKSPSKSKHLHYFKMQFKAIIALALASFGAAAAASEMHDAAMYAQSIAPGELARVGDFKSAHAANLTAAQTQFLDDALEAIGAPASADVAGLEKACGDVFGDLCAFILTGKTGTTPNNNSRRVVRRAGGGDMLNRRAACECSDGSDWCSGGYQCGLHEAQCAVGSRSFDPSPSPPPSPSYISWLSVYDLLTDDDLVGCGTFALYPCNGLCVQI
ncbi:hypothetical protein F5X99DRAFT_146259 [Biscogniauxia marginata]|nr:hypothetical protein F5X99DRAFT_146259 [Biscogniauxia marginata]